MKMPRGPDLADVRYDALLLNGKGNRTLGQVWPSLGSGLDCGSLTGQLPPTSASR